MEGRTFRFVAAAFMVAVGVMLALWLGSSASAALTAVAAGIVAHALAPRPAPKAASLQDASDSPQEAEMPDAQALINAVEEPVLLVRERRVVLANAAALSMLGDHIEGADVRLAIRHPAAAERLVSPAPSPERTTRVDLLGLGEPGRRWQMTTSPLHDGSLLVRLNDRSAAYAADQMRTDFVANASHELRTPLATVLGFLETLEDEETASDPVARGRFLRIMSQEAARMRQLVDDLLSLSRVEADRFALPREPVELGSVIAEVRNNLTSFSQERGSPIETDVKADQPIVAGDRPQLVQMLHNLAENALKYGRPGTPVRIDLEQQDSWYLLKVVDSGEGIAPEHLPRLTERFYRIDPGRSRAIGGTGLGLAIVKHIAERHRGRLEIRSALGEGTTVEVRLPRYAETLS